MNRTPIDYDASLHNFDVGAIGKCEKSWSPVETRGKPPRGRASHTATVLDSFRFVIVGGGECFPTGLWMHFGDAHVFDARSISWAELQVAADPDNGVFPPRRGHVAARCGPDTIVVFGGTDSGIDLTGMRNDCWLLDTAGLSWRLLPATGAVPAPRRGAAAHLADGHFLVVGGYTEVPDQSVYLLDMSTHVWSVAVTRGDPVPWFALAGYTGTGSSLYIFGGSPDAGFLRLGVYADRKSASAVPQTQLASATEAAPAVEVTQIMPRGEWPSPRFSHGMAMLANRWILVFGGTDALGVQSAERQTLNDCFLLDVFKHDAGISTVVGREVAPRGPRSPDARNGFSMVSLGTKLIVFGGGVYAERYYNDTWLLDLALDPDVSIASGTPGADLGADFEWLLRSPEGTALYDVTVSVGAATGCTQDFQAHRAVLCARCDYFRALLAGGFSEASRGCTKLPDCHPDTFDVVLSYLYTGRLTLPAPDIADDVADRADLDLWIAAQAGNGDRAAAALAAGADPDFLHPSEDARVIHVLCMPGPQEDVSVRIIEMLWSAGADFNAALPVAGRTPVQVAAVHGRKIVMAALLRALLRQSPEVSLAIDVGPDVLEGDCPLAAQVALQPACHVLNSADHLGLEHLCLLCEQWLARTVRRSTVFELILIADEFCCHQLRLICFHFVKRHRHCCKTGAFKCLPLKLRQEIVWACEGL